jgi:hypothetical protein
MLPLLAVVALVGALGPANAEGFDENLDLSAEGSGLDIAMKGVGLSDLETTGSESFSIDIGGAVEKAVLYWAGGGNPGEDDELLLNGNLVTAETTDTDTGPPAFTVVGYSADVTGIIQAECVTPGSCSLTIADGDLGNNFDSNLVGAGLLVIFTDPLDPNSNRIIVFDGVDWAFSREGVPETAPVVFSYPSAAVGRTGMLRLFASDNEAARTDRIDISDNPSLVNELVGTDGDYWDTIITPVDIPAGVDETVVVGVSPAEPPTADSLILQTVALRLTEGRIGCRFTGGGVDTSGNWDHTLEEGEMVRNGAGHLPEGVDRYQFGGQVGARTALPPQPSGEWTHHQQRGPSGKFTFHGGTSSAPEGTRIVDVRCMDPVNCSPARPAPAKQLDFDGIGTFRNIGNGGSAPAWMIPTASVVEEPNGNKAFSGTFHWFEVNIDDLGEPGGMNSGAPDGQICPSIGFGEKGATPLANCDCPDFYRITIYDGVDEATLMSSGPNKTDVIYEVWGYIDGGNLQIHPPTGFDK